MRLLIFKLMQKLACRLKYTFQVIFALYLFFFSFFAVAEGGVICIGYDSNHYLSHIHIDNSPCKTIQNNTHNHHKYEGVEFNSISRDHITECYDVFLSHINFSGIDKTPIKK